MSLDTMTRRIGVGQRRVVPIVAILGALGLMAFGVMSALAIDPANPAFERTWARTDRPVTELRVDRTWMWGPTANTGARQERYDDSPGGQRTVQYYDKARMEINNPDAPQDDPWYVTNGLLVKELITGQVQVGNTEFVPFEPASSVNVAGDPDDTTGPTYGTFTDLLNAPPLADGAPITWRLSRDGTVTNDPSLVDAGITAAYRVTVDGIDHQVASVFWDFMWSEGLVYEDDAYVTDLLFESPFYATGYPITEAYWAEVKVAGVFQDVLMQCFERRCLTYTPDNDPGWRVEAGNVGQHYFRWRYDRPTGSPTATITATTTPTETPTATASPSPTPPPPPEEQLFSAELTSDGVMPPVDSDASGMAYFYVPNNNSRIDYQIAVENIAGVTAAHLHIGDEIADLYSGGTISIGRGVLAEGSIAADDLPGDVSISELVEAMIAGEVYVDIETVAEPGGELRGQVMVLGDVAFSTTLSGEDANPPTDTDATGTAAFLYEREPEDIDYQLTIAGVRQLTMAHLHQGTADVTGPFLALLFGASSPVNGTIEANGSITQNDLPDAEVAEVVFLMLTGSAYVDTHTTANPTGEMRGQVVVGVDASTTGPWIAELFGSNVVPMVVTDASGYAIVEFTDEASLSYTVIVAGIGNVTSAQLRPGTGLDVDGDRLSLTLFEESSTTPAVENGILAQGVIPLKEIPAAVLFGILADGGYLTVETTSWPNGEIAGLLDPAPGTIFLAELTPDKVVAPDSTAPIESGATGVALFWSAADDTIVEYVVIVDELANPIRAYIQAGGIDDNGRVLAPLFSPMPPSRGTVNGVLVVGAIDAEDLEGQLADSTIADLIAEMSEGSTYVNVHTASYPSGEIRGQIAPLP